MATEQQSSPGSADTATPRRAKEAGAYRMSHDDIPQGVRDFVEKRNPGAEVYSAREGGSYKGQVVSVTEHLIVQMVGTDQRSAVAHKRDDIEFVPPKLKRQDERDDLAGRNIQVHYRGSEAKAYTWDAEKEKANRASAAQSRSQDAGNREAQPITREALETSIQKYAATLGTAKERDAFIAAMRETAKQAFQASRPGKDAQGADAAKTIARPHDRSAPEKTPAADLER